MNHKLLVSYDCGMHYTEESESEDPRDFKGVIESFEKEGLRWVVESDEGALIEVSSIHKGILNFMENINK